MSKIGHDEKEELVGILVFQEAVWSKQGFPYRLTHAFLTVTLQNAMQWLYDTTKYRTVRQDESSPIAM